MQKFNFDWITLVLFLPFLGSLIQAFFGKAVIKNLGDQYGKWVMGAFATLLIFASFGIAVSLTSNLLSFSPSDREIILTYWNWIHLADLKIPFELLIDPLSMAMTLMITGVSGLIHLYATGYMSKEKDYARFFTYMNLFVGFMLLLVLANNLALLFVGWEGVGLCSYLLIAFWHKDLKNAKAGNKAFIFNRIGDVAFLIGLFLLVAGLANSLSGVAVPDGRWLSYDVLFDQGLMWFKDHPFLTTLTALLLFGGAIGKSAQWPLYSWLPDAMAGPTPVSALIHAATMVTAGVYLLNRMHLVFELSPVASAVVSGVGAFTALFAALIAFTQTDIKKVLAFSTVSQLGYMFIACGVGVYWAGIFHVMTHAFFKALLFLGAGNVILAMGHEQDMRRYGNLWKYLPMTTWMMIIGWLAISGLPFLSGYWSKEAILSGALQSRFGDLYGWPLDSIVGGIGLFTAILTAAYMSRLTLLTFGVPFRKGEERWRTEHVHSVVASATEEGLKPLSDQVLQNKYGFFYNDKETSLIPILEEGTPHIHLEPEHTPFEASISMSLPIVILGMLSLGGGYWLYEGGLLHQFLSPSSGNLFVPFSVLHANAADMMSQSLIWMSALAVGLGLTYGLVVYWKGLPKREGFETSQWSLYRRAGYRQFGYDDLLYFFGVKVARNIAYGIYYLIDRWVIDGLVNTGGYVAAGVGGIARKIQTGYVRFYAFVMLLGGACLLGYFLYMLNKLGGSE